MVKNVSHKTTKKMEADQQMSHKHKLTTTSTHKTKQTRNISFYCKNYDFSVCKLWCTDLSGTSKVPKQSKTTSILHFNSYCMND